MMKASDWSPPPPMPCNARKATRVSIELASPASIEATRNTRIEKMNVGRRPKMSLILPMSRLATVEVTK